MYLVLPSVHVETLGVWIVAFDAVPALQVVRQSGARPPLRPTECSVYAYLTFCS